MLIPAAEPPVEYIAPEWLRRPSLEEVGRVYPPAAASRALDARVQLDCVADGAGRLESCAVASEEPAGSGFGAAALKLRTIYAMRPLLADGRSVAGGRVRVEVTFGYAELHRLGFVSPARND